MAFRLIAGLAFLAEYAWFAKSIPALFHIILSMLILTLGQYLWKLGECMTDETAQLAPLPVTGYCAIRSLASTLKRRVNDFVEHE